VLYYNDPQTSEPRIRAASVEKLVEKLTDGKENKRSVTLIQFVQSLPSPPSSRISCWCFEALLARDCCCSSSCAGSFLTESKPFFSLFRCSS
jgi:hypothetical protein